MCAQTQQSITKLCTSQVLSVVAQQLASIQAALRAHETVVFLCARDVPLKPCGVFITMNPGYSGRISLPDNLQALFRPMTLMAPDSTSVAEVVLFWCDPQNPAIEEVPSAVRVAALSYNPSADDLSSMICFCGCLEEKMSAGLCHRNRNGTALLFGMQWCSQVSRLECASLSGCT